MKVGSLVQWRLLDYPFLGLVLRDIGIKTKTKKYLIYWTQDDTIVECFETDLVLVSE